MENNSPAIEILSATHWFAIGWLVLMMLVIIVSKRYLIANPLKTRSVEIVFALSLLLMEMTYHVTYVLAGRWELNYSLPMELCSFSLFASIIVLITGNKKVIDFVFFVGIGGAAQAYATPFIDFGFPHFRYFHFFYIHGGIILTAFYFYWIKAYRPTFKGLLRTLVIINILLPIVIIINKLTAGNYMFLNAKPAKGTLFDYLGPYPYYIASLEGVVLFTFMILWIVFREKQSLQKVFYKNRQLLIENGILIRNKFAFLKNTIKG